MGFLVSVDVASTIEGLVTRTKVAWEAATPRSLSPLRALPESEVRRIEAVAWCVGILDVFEHSHRLHFGIIHVDALKVLVHQWLTLWPKNKIADRCAIRCCSFVSFANGRMCKCDIVKGDSATREKGWRWRALALEAMKLALTAGKVGYIDRKRGLELDWAFLQHCLIHE